MFFRAFCIKSRTVNCATIFRLGSIRKNARFAICVQKTNQVGFAIVHGEAVNSKNLGK
jgi:hypothetical protein